MVLLRVGTNNPMGNYAVYSQMRSQPSKPDRLTVDEHQDLTGRGPSPGLALAKPLYQLAQFGTYVNTGKLHEITRYIMCNTMCSGSLRN